MLKKENRLTKIIKVKGKTFPSSSFNIRIFDSEESFSKFGFVVSKKISKKAVTRNRTKRILRDIAKHILPKILANKNILVIAKKELERKQLEEVSREMEDIFRKINIIK